MGYRKVDPRTKAAAVKAMRKKVDAGETPAAAARELASKYDLAATTLQKYYTEATAEIVEPTTPASVVAPEATAAETEAEAAEDAQPDAQGGDTQDGALAVIDASTPRTHDTAASVTSADAFADQVQALSASFVRQLQAAALDDLIGKMQDLRNQLQTQ